MATAFIQMPKKMDFMVHVLIGLFPIELLSGLVTTMEILFSLVYYGLQKSCNRQKYTLYSDPPWYRPYLFVL